MFKVIKLENGKFGVKEVLEGNSKGLRDEVFETENEAQDFCDSLVSEEVQTPQSAPTPEPEQTPEPQVEPTPEIAPENN